MPKFRKKPVVIEAHQWFKNGDHPKDYVSEQLAFQNGRAHSIPPEYRRDHNWEGEVVRYFSHPEIQSDWSCRKCNHIYREHGWIDTLEGGHIVCPGDWIITGVQGEHYPCKPDIFVAPRAPGAKRLPHARLVRAGL